METAMQKFRDMEKSGSGIRLTDSSALWQAAVVYSLGINLFIVPVALYSGWTWAFHRY